MHSTKPSHYSAGDLKVASDLIRDEKITVKNNASKQFYIPISTFYSHLSGHHDDGKPSTKAILANEEEKFPTNVMKKY
ncbi:unnamed protein product [Rotaria sp. Silwood2]|nr:unnamed protein product [Rotaria sp. Silwood2]